MTVSGSGTEQRQGAVEERRDEEQADDGAHVSYGGSDPREATPLRRRHQIRQHGVVERLSGLIRVVGDHERDEDPAERADRRVPARWQARPADRLGTGNGERELAKNADCSARNA